MPIFLESHAQRHRETEVPAIVSIGKSFMLQPEKVQQGRVEVVEMNAIDGRLVPNVVGFSVGDAAFDTPSRARR